MLQFPLRSYLSQPPALSAKLVLDTCLVQWYKPLVQRNNWKALSVLSLFGHCFYSCPFATIGNESIKNPIGLKYNHPAPPCIAATQHFHGDQSCFFLPIALLTKRAQSGQVAAATSSAMESSLCPWKKCSLSSWKPGFLMCQNSKHKLYRWWWWGLGVGVILLLVLDFQTCIF